MTALIGLPATLMILSLTTTQAQAQVQPLVTLEAVDAIDLNNQAAWWSPIIHDPVEDATYLAYNRPYELAPDEGSTRDHVYIAKRDSNGNWTKADTGGRALFDPGHNQVSLAMDGDGHLHTFYGMHNDPMRHRVSDASRSIDQGFTSDSFASGSFTYPNVTTAPNGDLYMIVRDLPKGELYRYDNTADSWSQLGVFAEQTGTTVYPDHIIADQTGDLHLVWEWAAGNPQGSRHRGSYARFDPDTGTYYKADGTAYAGTPITSATADILQPLEGDETFTQGVHGFQSAKMTLDDQNRPIVAYAYSTDQTASGYEHRVARWDGSQWVRQTIEPGPFDTDKPWIAYSDGTLRYYGTVSPDSPLHTGTDDIFLRTSEDYGQTWSDPVAITSGLDIQRPVGTTVDGVDYLYLPSVSGEQLYFAEVTIPEPGSLGLLGVGGVLLASRRRRDRADSIQP